MNALKPRVILGIGIAALCTNVLPITANAQDIDDMPAFEDVLSLPSLWDVALSPDGERIAFTVRTPDFEENRFDIEIWLAAADGSAPFQLTRTAEGSSWSPQWSPNGELLAFSADRGHKNQVYMIRASGGEAWRVTDATDGVSDFAWSPDGQRLLLRRDEAESKTDTATTDTYGAFAIEDEPGRNSHLWIVELDAQNVAQNPERLTEGDFHVDDFAWSPDGSSVAYSRQQDAGFLSFQESDIHVIDVASGKTRALVTGPGPDSNPVWSPDGEWILFSEFVDAPDTLFYGNGELARIPAAGGDIELLTADFDEIPRGANWTQAGIYFAAALRTKVRVHHLDPDSRAIRALDQSVHAINAWTVTANGERLAFSAYGPSSVSELYAATTENPQSTLQKLTDYSAALADWPLGSRELITWQSEDGTEIEGVLWKPADFDSDKRYPLLVAIHGGPTGTSRPSPVSKYVYPLAHWAAKGAVILEPNYRGSAGYGEAFRSLNVRNLGVGDMWDVMSGVQHLIDAGIADPDRMGSMGWSQGGYISAFLATNTDAFKAISVGAGISNWMTYYVNTDIHPFTRMYLKATPWEDPEIYALTSPMTNILQASTPTLIQHGENDRRVPVPNAYELYQGLQDVGVESKLIIYKGFGHGINKPKELLAAVWHNWQWFNAKIWDEEIDLPLELDDDASAESD